MPLDSKVSVYDTRGKDTLGGAGSSTCEAADWTDAGFKRFDMAAITISGIELAEKIKKAHFQIGKRPSASPQRP
jgi:hypothetical protein